MKRTLFALVAFAAIIAVSCATVNTRAPNAGGSGGASAKPVERKVNNSVPQFVKDALKNAPEDALIGIGSAKMGTQALSRTAATTRARAEISRTLETMIKDMVTDYTASSEVDPSATLSFTENITTALSKSTLTGSVVVEMDYADDGTCWVVVQLGKTNAANEINQAQAAAKLAAPAMAAFNAADRMEAAFEKQAQQEIGYASN